MGRSLAVTDVSVTWTAREVACTLMSDRSARVSCDEGLIDGGGLRIGVAVVAARRARAVRDGLQPAVRGVPAGARPAGVQQRAGRARSTSKAGRQRRPRGADRGRGRRVPAVGRRAGSARAARSATPTWRATAVQVADAGLQVRRQARRGCGPRPKTSAPGAPAPPAGGRTRWRALNERITERPRSAGGGLQFAAAAREGSVKR